MKIVNAAAFEMRTSPADRMIRLIERLVTISLIELKKG